MKQASSSTEYKNLMDEQPIRPLHNWERSLFGILASDAGLPHEKIDEQALNNYRVQDMLDGGMGSIRFVGESGFRRCSQFGVARRWYKDSDGVEVSFELNLDDAGDPGEIDAWKVDFSALLQPPRATELQLRSKERIRPPKI